MAQYELLELIRLVKQQTKPQALRSMGVMGEICSVMNYKAKE